MPPARWVGGAVFAGGRRRCGVLPLRRWNGREPWLAQPGPHFLGRNGGKNPRGRRFLPWAPFWWGGEAVLTGYLVMALTAKGLTACPPAGMGRGWTGTLGKEEKTICFPLFLPSMNHPSCPPEPRAGHEALVLEAAVAPIPDQPPSSFLPPENGFQGEGTSFPGVLSYFLQRNRALARGHRSCPVPTAPGKNPTPPEHIPPGMGIFPPQPFIMYPSQTHAADGGNQDDSNG